MVSDRFSASQKQGSGNRKILLAKISFDAAENESIPFYFKNESEEVCRFSVYRSLRCADADRHPLGPPASPARQAANSLGNQMGTLFTDAVRSTTVVES